MALLDKEVLRSLIKIRNLDQPVVARSEELLSKPPELIEFDQAMNVARGNVERALLGWLVATQDWMHRTSSLDSN